MSDLHHHIKLSRALPLIILLSMLSACGGGDGSGGGIVSVSEGGNKSFTSQVSLTYGDGDLSFTRGKTITPVNPDPNGATIISYAVTPPLPAGLRLDGTSGIISGTPSAVSPQQIYKITGTYSGGVVTTGLKLDVLATESAPAFISYNCIDCSFVTGQPIALEPEIIGGEPTLFTAQNPLPPSLNLNSVTGVVSGTLTDPSERASYTIIASNDAGKSVPYDLTFAVQDGVAASALLANPELSIVPANLSYGNTTWYEFTIFGNLPVTTLRPTVTNSPCKDFKASPTLPKGLNLATDEGDISGTPTELSAETSYTITCTDINSSATTSVTLTLSVTDRQTGFLNGDNFFNDGNLTWTKITQPTPDGLNDGRFNYLAARTYCDNIKLRVPNSKWELPGPNQIPSLWKAVSDKKVDGQGWNFASPGIWIEPNHRIFKDNYALTLTRPYDPGALVQALFGKTDPLIVAVDINDTVTTLFVTCFRSR